MVETELEKLRKAQLAARLRGAALQPNAQPTSSQMSPVPPQPFNNLPVTDAQRTAANQDFAGRNALIAQQMRQGYDQLTQQGPQGKQVGGIYAAPTWSENLAGAVGKGLGGYEMAQARKAKGQLKQDRLEKAAGLAAVQAEERQNEYIERDNAQQQQNVENDLANRQLERAVAADQNTADYRAGTLLNDAAKTADTTSRWKTELDYERERDEADRLMERDLSVLEQTKALDPYENMTSAEKVRINKEAGTFKNLAAAVLQAEKVQSEGGEIGGWKDIPIEKVTSWFGEGAGNALANSDIFGYTPAEMAVRGSIDGATEQYRRAFTGANLTQIEKFLGANWDPTATGVDTQEKIDRSRRLLDVLNTNREVFDLEAFEVPGKYQGGSAPDSNDIPVDVSVPSVDDMTEEEFMALSEEERNRILGK